MHRPLERSELTAAFDESNGERPRLRDGVLFCVVVFLGVRILLSVVAVIAVRDTFPAQSGVVGAVGQGAERPATSGLHNAVDGTVRWDAFWYLAIAREGYDTSGREAAFFPAYPLVTRAVAEASPFGEVGAALFVSNLAFLGALIALHALGRLEYSDAVARRAVVLLAIFPTSFFFMAPYGESMFLLFALLSFWCARQDRWFLAALAAAVALATRATGVVLIPCLLIEATSERHSSTPISGRVVASVSPLLALAAYCGWWFERSGDLLAPLHAQGEWLRTVAFPLYTLGSAISLGIQGVGDPRGIYWTADAVLTLWVIIPLLVAWRRIPSSMLTYAGLSLLIPLTYPIAERPLVSVPRYVLAVFPAFLAMALLLDRPVARRIVVAASVAGFVIASVAFMNWGYIF
jgi:hypothetical protein